MSYLNQTLIIKASNQVSTRPSNQSYKQSINGHTKS